MSRASIVTWHLGNKLSSISPFHQQRFAKSTLHFVYSYYRGIGIVEETDNFTETTNIEPSISLLALGLLIDEEPTIGISKQVLKLFVTSWRKQVVPEVVSCIRYYIRLSSSHAI